MADPITDITTKDIIEKNPALPETSPAQAATGVVDQPTQTVQGQITGLLDEDSDYITRARARGNLQAQQRGLLNSSIAAGAAEASAIDAALPIAQQDAQTYTNQSFKNQDTQQQTELFNTDFQNQAFFREQDVANKIKVDQNTFQNAMESQQSEQDFRTQLAEMDKALQQQLAANQVSQQDRAAFADYVGDTSQQYQVQQSKIAADPGMDVEEKNRALADLQATFQSNMQVMADLYAVDISWTPGEGVVPATGTQMPNLTPIETPSVQKSQPMADEQEQRIQDMGGGA